MIKFFRHIRKSLLMENKTSKYFKYAIGEILLVMIGILLALQVNNWNQNRIDKTREITLLEQLLDNFLSNKKNIEKGLKNYEIEKKYLECTIRNTGPEVEIPDSVTLDSISSINYVTVELVFGSKNNMFSNQQIELITNNDLKRALFTFPNYYDDYKDGEDLIKELTITQRKIHQKYISLSAATKQFKQNAFESNFLAWLRDRDFQNVTVDKIWVLNGAKSNLKTLADKNLEVINQLTEIINTEQ